MGKHEKNFKNLKRKKEKSFGFAKKVQAPIPIPKVDLGFSSRYQKMVSVAHYCQLICSLDLSDRPNQQFQ